MESGAFRKTEHGVDERFLNRWSPRAMSGGLWVPGRGDGRPRETGPKRGASGEPPGTGVPFRTERLCGSD